jgi:hypothetical protein
MAESPVVLQRVECQDGKRKTIVREREYDLRSWQGLKTLVTIIVGLAGVVVAVLTAYYSAEAAQDARIAAQAQHMTKIEERHDGREKAVDNVLEKFDKTLTEQRILIRENTDRMIEVQTTQKMIHENVKTIAEDVKKLGKE